MNINKKKTGDVGYVHFPYQVGKLKRTISQARD